MKRLMILASLAAMAAPAAAQNAAAGGALFNRSCKMCHSVEAGKPSGIGPNLRGVMGRPAASVAGYRYSAALTKAAIRWDNATLDRFLAKPQAAVPGNKMPFAGIAAPADRANVAAYLAQQK